LLGISEVGAYELFAQAGFELQPSWSLSPKLLVLLVSGAQLNILIIICLCVFSFWFCQFDVLKDFYTWMSLPFSWLEVFYYCVVE
jgi:hypothetical protein